MVAGHLEVKRGIYQCVLNYTDENGKRERQSISTGLSEKGNKKRAEKILMDLRRTFQPPVDQTARIISGLSSEMMFSDYMLQWLEIVKTRIKPATYSSYCLMVKKTIAPYFAEKSIRLGELEPRHIQQFYSEQLKRVKANTVIHYHANIHSALKYAMKIDLIDVNVADKVDRPKKNDFMPGFYDADEMQELFAALKGHKLELVVLVAAFYGLRRGEVLGLKWDAIDFERNTITIKRTVASVNIDGKVTIIEQDSAKTKSSLRTLPLVSQFREYFLSVQEAQKENKKVCGNSYDYSHDGYVFVDALGRRMKPDYISSTFSVLLEKKGLKRIRFHDLRHSCASLLLANGVPMKQIQEWLGHSDFNTTANIYAHLDYSSKVTSAQAMEKGLPLPAGFNTNGWNGVVSI